MGLLDQWEALKGYIAANTPRNTRASVSPAQVIDQGLLGGRIANIPQRAQEIKRGLLNIPQDLAQLTSPEVSQAVQAAMAGKGNQVNPQQWIDAGLELSGMAPVTALGGMFIGKGAKTWDVLKAKQAEEMLAKGIDPREVWKQTGTLKGVDGALRQEIPDNAATFNKDGIKKIYEYGYRPQEQVFSHDELYSAYPELGKVSTTTTHTSGIAGDVGQYGGAFDGDNMISLGVPRTKADIGKANSVNVHELQHAIQQREGWARGGSPENVNALQDQLRARLKFLETEPDYLKANELYDQRLEQLWKQYPDDPDAVETAFGKFHEALMNTHPSYRETQDVMGQLRQFDTLDPMDAYRRLAGEAEARLTQSRMGLDAAQRLQHYPYDQGPYGLDVPMDQMIVRGLLDGPAMSKADEAGGLLGKSANVPDMSYQIDHKPLTVDGGASTLDDLTGAFGEDIYGKNALQYFGSGAPEERTTLKILQSMRGKPDELVSIYRGVPDGVNDINPGDWVTLDKNVAQMYADPTAYGEGTKGAGKVIELKVPARSITSWPDSLLEFGYYPD